MRKTFQLFAFSNLQVDLLDVRVTKIGSKRGGGGKGKKEKNSTSNIDNGVVGGGPAYVDQNAVIPIFSGASNWLRDNNSASL